MNARVIKYLPICRILQMKAVANDQFSRMLLTPILIFQFSVALASDPLVDI